MKQEQKERVAKEYAWAHSTMGIDKRIFASEDNCMIHPCQMVRVPIYNKMETAVLFGLNYAEKSLWKPAQGDDLPEYNREVVVFQTSPEDKWMMRVAIAHRPDPNGWDGKSMLTGKVEHYTPKTYGQGGWNIPDVVWWLDSDLPVIEEE